MRLWLGGWYVYGARYKIQPVNWFALGLDQGPGSDTDDGSDFGFKA